jgi:hypothetical protein
MNERIKELAEQALEEFKAENKYATIIVPNPLKEKFAELIIQQCMDVVAKKCASPTAYNALAEHWGVEE